MASKLAFVIPDFMELIFEIRDAEEVATTRAPWARVFFTQADTWDDLRANVLEAVSLHFGAATRPGLVQMHYV